MKAFLEKYPFLILIIAIAFTFTFINCRGTLTTMTKDLEVVCLNQFHLNEEEHWARDIGIAVDGRLAYSENNYNWYWADSREPINRFSDTWWALHNLTEETFPTVIHLDDKKERVELGPNPPPCVQAKLDGVPCEDCDNAGE